MASAVPAASRSGATVDKKPVRRLDGRAWREIDCACKTGKKHDAYSVELHGVRVVFKLGAQESQVESTSAERASMPASRQHVKPTSESAPRQRIAPNAEQRRSAKRMQTYILAKKSEQERTAPASGSDARKAVAPAQVDDDVRMDREPTTAATPGRGGQKRAAVEPTSCSQPKAAAAQQQQPQRQRVESTPAAAPPRAARDISPRPSRERCLTTCRTCGGGPKFYTGIDPARPGRPREVLNSGRWCRCGTPCYYERKVYGSPGHGT